MNTAYRALVFLNGCNLAGDNAWQNFKFYGHNHGDWTLYANAGHMFRNAEIYATADISAYNAPKGHNITLIGSIAGGSANDAMTEDGVLSMLKLNTSGNNANIYVEVTDNHGFENSAIYGKDANSVNVYCHDGGDCNDIFIECPDNNLIHSCRIHCDDSLGTRCTNMKIFSNKGYCTDVAVLCHGSNCLFGNSTNIYCGYGQNATYCNLQKMGSSGQFVCINHGSGYCNNNYTEQTCQSIVIDPPISISTTFQEDVCDEIPTIEPTEHPTETTLSPTNIPFNPTVQPTMKPLTSTPTGNPSISPSNAPSRVSTDNPTPYPSVEPTNGPTTLSPTFKPTNNPSSNPSRAPSMVPTNNPTFLPSTEPTNVLTTVTPTGNPFSKYSTNTPTSIPTHMPSSQPSTPHAIEVTTVETTRMNDAILSNTEPNLDPTKSPFNFATNSSNDSVNESATAISGSSLIFLIGVIGACVLCIVAGMIWACIRTKRKNQRIKQDDLKSHTDLSMTKKDGKSKIAQHTKLPDADDTYNTPISPTMETANSEDIKVLDVAKFIEEELDIEDNVNNISIKHQKSNKQGYAMALVLSEDESAVDEMYKEHKRKDTQHTADGEADDLCEPSVDGHIHDTEGEKYELSVQLEQKSLLKDDKTASIVGDVQDTRQPTIDPDLQHKDLDEILGSGLVTQDLVMDVIDEDKNVYNYDGEQDDDDVLIGIDTMQ